MNILVVDDDLATRKMVRFILEQQAGHTVDEAPSAAEVQAKLSVGEYDLLLLDVAMPGLDGVGLCQRIRRTSNVPIMMVSAHGDVAARVRGLQAGADDYLPKPFDAAELAARVAALSRRLARSARVGSDGRMRLGDLTLDLTEHTVQVRRVGVEAKGRKVSLTPTEFKLLLTLARESGRVFTRTELELALWGSERSGDAEPSNTVNAYISTLRGRLEDDPRQPRYLVTVRGAGYKLEP